MKKIIPIFFFLIIPLFIFSETQVLIRTSANNATIGDAIAVKVVVRTSPDIDQVSLKITPKEFEIVSESDWKRESHKDYQVFEKDLGVSFFKLGDFKLGPFGLEVKRGGETIESKETNTLSVSIKSVLTKEDTDIKPLKDLAEIKGDPFYLLKYVLLALVIIGVIIFLIFWLKKRKSLPLPSTKPELSPVDELEFNIRGLFAEKFWEKGRQLEFFIHLIDYLKIFLFRTYHLNAEDLTTFEIFYYLKQKEENGEILGKMEYIFHMADLVKFAKYLPDLSIEKEIHSHVNGLLIIYKKLFHPPVEDVT